MPEVFFFPSHFHSFAGILIRADAHFLYQIRPIYADEQKSLLISNNNTPDCLRPFLHWFELYENGFFVKPDPDALHFFWNCSAFARDVYHALINVPAGSFITYGELARIAGHAGAARAVGHAMNINPFPIVIPCHRVISIRNPWLFAFGESIKRELVAHETLEKNMRFSV